MKGPRVESPSRTSAFETPPALSMPLDKTPASSFSPDYSPPLPPPCKGLPCRPLTEINFSLTFSSSGGCVMRGVVVCYVRSGWCEGLWYVRGCGVDVRGCGIDVRVVALM